MIETTAWSPLFRVSDPVCKCDCVAETLAVLVNWLLGEEHAAVRRAVLPVVLIGRASLSTFPFG